MFQLQTVYQLDRVSYQLKITIRVLLRLTKDLCDDRICWYEQLNEHLAVLEFTCIILVKSQEVQWFPPAWQIVSNRVRTGKVLEISIELFEVKIELWTLIDLQFYDQIRQRIFRRRMEQDSVL